MPQTHTHNKHSLTGKAGPRITGAGVAASSRAASVWQGFTLEHWRLPPTEAPDTVLRQHHVAVQLSPPLLVEWKQRGRFVQTRLLPNDISLLSCGDAGAFRWQEGHAELIVCALEPAFIHSVLPDRVKQRDLELQLLKGRQDEQILRLLHCLKTEMENGYSGGRLFGEHLASALVLLLLQNYAVFKSDVPAFADSLERADLRTALDYIHDNLSSDLGLAEIAQAACLSVSQFSRLFKQAAGYAPHEYVIRARVERAKTLLRRSEISVTQIAAEVGFYDTAHFVRHFKRRTGLTPQQMRRDTFYNG